MDLFFRKIGEGASVIILHGLYGASDNWLSVGNALSTYFEVFLIDQRNHGQSPHSDKHEYPEMANDLLQFMNSQSIEKAIIIGHSMGGKTAMLFSLLHPERVSRLIIVDIAPKSYALINESRSINHHKIIHAMLSLNLNEITSREEAEKELLINLNDERLVKFLSKNLHRTKENKFAWRLNLNAIQTNFNHILANIIEIASIKKEPITGFPVLFIKGGNSDYITDTDKVEILSIFPYADFITIPNAGHWLHAEKQDIFLKKVNDFIFE